MTDTRRTAVLLCSLLLAAMVSAQARADFSDAACKAAFLDHMNRKAAAIGLTATHFADGSGIVPTHSTITAIDALRLALCADGYRGISDAWGAESYDLHIGGRHERTVTLVPRDRTPFTNYYHLLGAKTGTLQGCNNAIVIGEDHEGGKYVMVVVGSTWTERWRDVRKLMDIGRRKRKDAAADVRDIRLTATSGLVCAYRAPLPLQLRFDPLPILYAKQPDEVRLPASVTKTMTAICMLDLVDNLDSSFEIKKSDLTGGSGPVFFDGDSITFRDALYAMFIPSSNTVAVALSRVIGRQILSRPYNRNASPYRLWQAP